MTMMERDDDDDDDTSREVHRAKNIARSTLREIHRVKYINKINLNLYSAKSSLKTIQGALHVHDNMFLKRITQMYN